MTKRIIASIISILLICESIIFTTFAEGSVTLPEDVVRFSDNEKIIYQEDFEDGTVGQPVADYTFADRKPADTNVYSTFTVSENIGTNTTKVGNMYNMAHLDLTERITDSGEPDPNGVSVRGNGNVSNREYFYKAIPVEDSMRVQVSFDMYNAYNAKRGSSPDIQDKIVVGISNDTVLSSDYPYARIGARYAWYGKKVYAGGGSYTKSESSIRHEYYEKEWIHVVFDIERYQAIHPNTQRPTWFAKVNLSVNDVAAPETIYDGLAEENWKNIVLGIYENDGGRIYIDNIKVKEINLCSASMKEFVNNYSFSDACEGTNNTQDAVVESWANGLPTSVTNGDETYEVQWTSSDPDIITKDGFIRRRRFKQTATLTAKFIVSPMIYAEKDFVVKVSETDLLEDYVTYDNNVEVVYSQDFEGGVVGESVPGYTVFNYNHSGTLTGTTLSKYTFAENIGGNKSKVGSLYDAGYTKDGMTRVDDDGNPDDLAWKMTGYEKDFEGYVTTDTLFNSKHIRLKFKYYCAENALQAGTPVDMLNVSFVKTTGRLASLSPMIEISPTSVNCHKQETISGIPRKTWNSVVFDLVFSDDKKSAECTINVNGVIVKTSYPTVDDVKHVYFGHDYSRGGKYYLDDIVIEEIYDYPETLKNAVDSLDFNYIGQGTNNAQDDVNEDWEEGFPTSITSGDQTYNIVWTTSDASIITADGIVTKKSYKRSAILTATITLENGLKITKEFDVVVSALSGQTEAGILRDYANDYIKEELFSNEVTAESNSIKTDLVELPTRDYVANIDIRWESSHPEIISNTGKVTRPDYVGEDTLVTLTAYLSRDGGDPVTKELKYNVIKLPHPDEVLQEAMDDLVLTDEPTEKITKDLNLPTSYGDVAIAWDTTNHTQIADNGAVTRGDVEIAGSITGTFSLRGFTAQKTYNFTVYPTLQKMMEIDVNLINKTGWDALTGNFTVPLIGEKYFTEFVWSSTDRNIVVGDNGQMQVRRPSFSSGNASFSLIVHATNGGETADIAVPVTVLCQEDDAIVVQNAADTINFDLIRDEADTQDAVTKNLALPKTFDYDKDMYVVWSSSDENVVTTSGEVIRPLPGSPAAHVVLTAIVKKHYAASLPVVIEFDVKPFVNVDELLDRAKQSLVFAELSDEEINEVTKDLYLPTEWKYDTTIEWSCASPFVEIAGNEAIITRPEWGETGGMTTLLATISYNGETGSGTVYKSFNINILEKEDKEVNETSLDEDFNDWTEDYNFNMTTGDGAWLLPEVGTGSVASFEEDPLNASNKVLCLTLEDDQLPAGNVNYTLNSGVENSAVFAGMKIFVDNSFTGVASFEILSSLRSQIVGRINGEDSTLEIDANINNEQKALKLSTADIVKGAWNEFEFVINTEEKKFDVYVNGECVTDNGDVVVLENSEVFDTSAGIPFLYYNDETIPGDIKGFMWNTNQGSLFIDDISISKKLVYSEKQKNAAKQWKNLFLASNNVSSIKSNLVLPNLIIDGIAIGYECSNTDIIGLTGHVYGVENPTDVEWIVTFYDGNTTYREKYILKVTKIVSGDTGLDDQQSVNADLNDAVTYINSNYNLTDLRANIVYSNSLIKNGSTISFKSSDTSSLSDTGVVTLKENAVTLTLTVTAEKGIVKKSQTLQVTVGKKAKPSNEGGPVGGGGGGGGKPSLGPNTNEESVTNPESENNNENNSENQATSSFTDVAKDHWAYDQINYMVENKIMNGVGDGKIEPERTILREEFVKMLVMALRFDLMDTAADFTDVDADEWYAPYVATIKEKGLILGYEDGSFGIGQNISRQDLAVLIYRSAGLESEEIKDVFADDTEIADYAKDAVYTLRDLGIINGKGEGKFDPTASATRAETATMLYKAIKQGLFE